MFRIKINVVSSMFQYENKKTRSSTDDLNHFILHRIY